jgi:hypothetical protein
MERYQAFSVNLRMLKFFEHYMNLDENVDVVSSVGISINKNIKIDLMIVNDDMINDLASEFKKHLEKEGCVQKKMSLRDIWVMIVRILIILN